MQRSDRHTYKLLFPKICHIFMRLVLQVVEIGSTWRRLRPELSCDYRPSVVRAIAELLALVPQLTVKSEEYEVFVRLRKTFDDIEASRCFFHFSAHSV